MMILKEFTFPKAFQKLILKTQNPFWIEVLALMVLLITLRVIIIFLWSAIPAEVEKGSFEHHSWWLIQQSQVVHYLCFTTSF